MKMSSPTVTSSSPTKTKYASSSRVCVCRGTLIPGARPISRRQYAPPVSAPDKQTEPTPTSKKYRLDLGRCLTDKALYVGAVLSSIEKALIQEQKVGPTLV